MNRHPEHLSIVVDRVMRDLRRQRLFAQVYGLGPRPCLELLLEIHNGADLDSRLARYAAPPTLRMVE